MPLPLEGPVQYDRVKGTKISKPGRNAVQQAYVKDIADGLAITMHHFFKNTKEMIRGTRPDAVNDPMEDGVTTLEYPFQKRPYPERFRGVHRLTHRADGSPRCVACLCCSTACPAQCIYIEAGEYPEGDKKRGYEKYPVKFVIDELRCIFCGFCVEACPCDAIRMDTGMHPQPYDSRDQFVFGKSLLMSFVSADGEQQSENPRREPGEKGFAGITRLGQHH